MHSVMGVVAALVVSAAGGESEATESDTVPEMEGRRTFVGLAVPLSSGGLATHRWGTHTGTVLSSEGEPQTQSTPFRSWNVGHRAQLAVGWAF